LIFYLSEYIRQRESSIVTELAVFQRSEHQSPFKLIELAPGVDADVVREKTAHYVE